MTPFDPAIFNPTIAELVRGPRLAPLGPGTPDQAVRPQLAALTAEGIFAPQPVRDRRMAEACLAGLWLLHDFLDESHRLSQDIDTPAGSYWHGIMHRREPDAGNAKYWFRRVGDHPVLRLLAEQAPTLGYRYTDAFAFVDFCERVRDSGSPEEELARQVQQLEWRLLFEHCYRAALGDGGASR
jgi:hypothetical protein